MICRSTRFQEVRSPPVLSSGVWHGTLTIIVAAGTLPVLPMGMRCRGLLRDEEVNCSTWKDLGQVAQLVEQRTENPCVGGSSPPLPI